MHSASNHHPVTPHPVTPHPMALLIHKLERSANLSGEERRAIEGLPGRTRTLGAGQDIMREGDAPSQCCLVIEGWACRYKVLGEGRRQIFSFHIPGDLPDLQSLHLHTMDHSLATITEATVAFIAHEDVRDLMLRCPRLGALLWRETLIDAAIFREWMAGIGRKSAYGRIGHLFCEMYAKLEAVGLADGHRCSFPITQGELADALGLSNVHVNRTLQQMRGRGLITLHGNTLVLHDWAKLIQASEFDPTYLRLEKAG